MITIFTDGSARGNPGPGGWGVIILTDDTALELGGRGDHTTNNRMELTAVISGLEHIPKERELTIFSIITFLTKRRIQSVFLSILSISKFSFNFSKLGNLYFFSKKKYDFLKSFNSISLIEKRVLYI